MQNLYKIVKLLSLSFLMVSCAHFPELHPHLISIKDGKCVEYDCTQDSCNTTCTIKQEWPMDHCDLFTALPPEDIAALKVYQKKMCTTQ